MKPAAFDYLIAESLPEAMSALAADEDAKVLAGGQSLIPLLSLRLARPSVLVDIGRLALDRIEMDHGDPEGDVLRVGALVTHSRLEHDPVLRTALPLLADAARHVGYPAIRHRGTLGGTLAHADPVAEIPAAAVALGATLHVAGPDGSRQIRAVDLADGYFSTVLTDAEIIVAVEFGWLAGPHHGAAWCEWAPRAHDFAHAGVGVTVELDPDGTCVKVRAAAAGLATHAVDLTPIVAEAGVLGGDLSGLPPALTRAVAAAVTGAAAGAGEDKADLAGLLAARALKLAVVRVGRQRTQAA